MFTDAVIYLSNETGGEFNLALIAQLALFGVFCLCPLLVLAAKLGGGRDKRNDNRRRH